MATTTRQPIIASGFILDGYNVQGFLRGVPYRYPDVHFDYRPPSPGDRAVILSEAKKADPRKAEEIAAMAICKYLIAWDLKDEKGELLDCKSPSVFTGNGRGHIDIAIGQRLWEIVVLGSTSDIDPEWEDPNKRATISNDLNFLKPEAEQVSDAKN